MLQVTTLNFIFTPVVMGMTLTLVSTFKNLTWNGVTTNINTSAENSKSEFVSPLFTVYYQRQHGHAAPQGSPGVPGLPPVPGQEETGPGGHRDHSRSRSQCAPHGLVAPAVPLFLSRIKPLKTHLLSFL